MCLRRPFITKPQEFEFIKYPTRKGVCCYGLSGGPFTNKPYGLGLKKFASMLYDQRTVVSEYFDIALPTNKWIDAYDYNPNGNLVPFTAVSTDYPISLCYLAGWHVYSNITGIAQTQSLTRCTPIVFGTPFLQETKPYYYRQLVAKWLFIPTPSSDLGQKIRTFLNRKILAYAKQNPLEGDLEYKLFDVR